ncbi:hypothetical protein [Luteibacter aegosomatissinici]|uniref:hypothetical protein n=1 Tax=Luteibacter aegosomatissinici TaxID=2911539 RepID=UPI001FFAF955|nr:hypothetical protein [Luteibacter aegosomatissinici]UPG94012.1 hypothetical protein L2Y97_19655 [Luteibacter aegosomatissinici]
MRMHLNWWRAMEERAFAEQNPLDMIQVPARVRMLEQELAEFEALPYDVGEVELHLFDGAKEYPFGIDLALANDIALSFRRLLDLQATSMAPLAMHSDTNVAVTVPVKVTMLPTGKGLMVREVTSERCAGGPDVSAVIHRVTECIAAIVGSESTDSALSSVSERAAGEIERLLGILSGARAGLGIVEGDNDLSFPAKAIEMAYLAWTGRRQIRAREFASRPLHRANQPALGALSGQ